MSRYVRMELVIDGCEEQNIRAVCNAVTPRTMRRLDPNGRRWEGVILGDYLSASFWQEDYEKMVEANDGKPFEAIFQFFDLEEPDCVVSFGAAK